MVHRCMTHFPWSLFLIHACMMHLSMFLCWIWCMCTCVWCTYLWSWTLILSIAWCMMHDAWCMCVWCTYPWSWTLILKHACMYGACVYDAANFVPNERTNGRTILGVWYEREDYLQCCIFRYLMAFKLIDFSQAKTLLKSIHTQKSSILMHVISWHECEVESDVWCLMK